LLIDIDQQRLYISSILDIEKKSAFGQYLTPTSIARYMASMFKPIDSKECKLLDPGVGLGSLTMAFLDKWINVQPPLENVEVDTFEVDDYLNSQFRNNLINNYSDLKVNFTLELVDFIENSVQKIKNNNIPHYSHAIINPPYKKIKANSENRRLLSSIGIETVNIYSAFIALSLLLLKPGGQLVAIVPRSFCNGVYYKSFRQFLIKEASILHIHIFSSRDKAFKDDSVLQENIIILLERGTNQENVVISTSTDETFSDYNVFTHPFNHIVSATDPDFFINIPTNQHTCQLESLELIKNSLGDLNIEVSTGPVVDFRNRKELRSKPEKNTGPLLYPHHLSDFFVNWPSEHKNKLEYIQVSDDTKKILYPIGYYVVVRRFSSKDEKRRVNACVVSPKNFKNISVLGFENHINVFHKNKQGLSEELALGIAVYLNSKLVDDQVRQFNGHTQINVADLRHLYYPNLEGLITLGNWAKTQKIIRPDNIDKQIINLV